MRRILRPTFLVLLSIFILITGCSSGAGQPTAQPTSTLPPEDEGSALLLYVLSSDQPSTGFKASSDIGIPIFMMVDPENTKDMTPITGTTVADYFMQVASGNDQGWCFTEYSFLVEYSVLGYYNPEPTCDFALKITMKVLPDEVVRSKTCIESLEVSMAQVVKGLVIPPPAGLKENNGFHMIPESLPVVTIRKDEHVKITIELKNVVVPPSSGCIFGD